MKTKNGVHSTEYNIKNNNDGSCGNCIHGNLIFFLWFLHSFVFTFCDAN